MRNRAGIPTVPVSAGHVRSTSCQPVLNSSHLPSSPSISSITPSTSSSSTITPRTQAPATVSTLPQLHHTKSHGFLNMLIHGRGGVREGEDGDGMEWKCKGEDLENFTWPPHHDRQTLMIGFKKGGKRDGPTALIRSTNGSTTSLAERPHFAFPNSPPSKTPSLTHSRGTSTSSFTSNSTSEDKPLPDIPSHKYPPHSPIPASDPSHQMKRISTFSTSTGMVSYQTCSSGYPAICMPDRSGRRSLEGHRMTETSFEDLTTPRPSISTNSVTFPPASSPHITTPPPAPLPRPASASHSPNSLLNRIRPRSKSESRLSKRVSSARPPPLPISSPLSPFSGSLTSPYASITSSPTRPRTPSIPSQGPTPPPPKRPLPTVPFSAQDPLLPTTPQSPLEKLEADQEAAIKALDSYLQRMSVPSLTDPGAEGFTKSDRTIRGRSSGAKKGTVVGGAEAKVERGSYVMDADPELDSDISAINAWAAWGSDPLPSPLDIRSHFGESQDQKATGFRGEEKDIDWDAFASSMSFDLPPPAVISPVGHIPRRHGGHQLQKSLGSSESASTTSLSLSVSSDASSPNSIPATINSDVSSDHERAGGRRRPRAFSAAGNVGVVHVAGKREVRQLVRLAEVEGKKVNYGWI